jgi:hypothetical protein
VHLFRSRKTEPEPITGSRWAAQQQTAHDADQRKVSAEQELTRAVAEESAAADAVASASRKCAELDSEWKNWTQRRDAAFRDFSECAARYADAKSEVARRSKTATVTPIVVAAGVVR